MKIYGINYGGFGNAIFNKLGTILLWILFPNVELVSFETQEEIDEYKKTAIEINDEYFLKIVNDKIERYTDIMDQTKTYWVHCFCQYDEIYTRYKRQIIDYILAHPQEKIFSGHINRFFPMIDILSEKETEIYDILLHVRLGDFLGNGWILHPECVRDIFSKTISSIQDASKIAILVDHQETELEKRYVEYIREVYPTATIISGNADILYDYNLIRNAKHVICSCSTFSWISVFFAREYQSVTFPNYDHRWQHEQFRKCHDRFTYYNISRISETDLRQFLLS